MGRLIGFLGLLFLSACSLPTARVGVGAAVAAIVTDVPGYTLYGRWEIEPPFEYEVEFSDARDCIRVANVNGVYGQPRRIKFEDVRWFLTDSIRKHVTPGRVTGAITQTDKLWITVTKPWQDNLRVIYHESLHAWLGLDPTHGQGSFLFCDPFRTPRGP